MLLTEHMRKTKSQNGKEKFQLNCTTHWLSVQLSVAISEPVTE